MSTGRALSELERTLAAMRGLGSPLSEGDADEFVVRTGVSRSDLEVACAALTAQGVGALAGVGEGVVRVLDLRHPRLRGLPDPGPT